MNVHHEDFTGNTNRYEKHTRKILGVSIANLALGAVATGVAVYNGVKGLDGWCEGDIFGAALNYSIGIRNIIFAIRRDQNIADFRGAEQFQLTNDSIEPQGPIS
jgi:hypothetical protein